MILFSQAVLHLLTKLKHHQVVSQQEVYIELELLIPLTMLGILNHLK